MEIYQLPRDRVIYNYRYFLPYAPEWGDETFCSHRLEQLLDYCQKAQVDAVQFFVNTLPGTYYMPAHNADEQRHWAKWMKDTVAPAVRSIGVSYQLNLQMILGSVSYGVDMRDEYNWEFLVSEYGDTNYGCACPLGPSFRTIMGEMLQLWAGTQPDIIWVDDDFRMHNHGSTAGSPDYYCYCDLHLNAFAERAGRRYTREDILQEITKPGDPSPLRKEWLDFLGDTMVDTADWLRSNVHSVSPQTRLALMTSSPEVHSAEGRKWKPMLEALCKPYTPMTRPMCGIYTGTTVPVKSFACTYNYMHQSMAILEDEFGQGIVDYGPELENTRFTTWAKSRSATRYMLLVAQLCGCNQITLSINDLDGSPIMEEPSSISILKDNKPQLQTLTDMNLREWLPLGVCLLTDANGANRQQTDTSGHINLLDTGRTWPQILLEMGIPCRYINTDEYRDGVLALDKYSAWLPSDDKLENILSGKVLMDADAALVIQQRGFGKYLGVEIGDLHKTGLTSEKYRDSILPGVSEIRVPHRGFLWRDMVLDGATLVSEFIDPKNNYHPGSAIFENSLGGKIAVYASIGEMAMGTFGSHARLRWLHGILQWLSQGDFPVLPVIPHHCLTIARQRDDEMLVAIANLGTDVLEKLQLNIPDFKGNSLDILDRSGKWIPRQVCIDKCIDIDCQLGVFDMLILRLAI